MCILSCNQDNTDNLEISICPTLVIPLVTNKNYRDSNVNRCIYNTRVLLDTGSSVNWVSPDVLKKVEYKIISSKNLEVNSFNKVEKLNYKLVKIKVNNDHLGSITCFVMKNSSNAQIIKNLYKYVNEYADNNGINIFPWVNPYDASNVDYNIFDQKPFYGLIVSGHYVNYIKHDLEEELSVPIIIQHKSLDVVLEITSFGYYVTGMVPVDKDETNMHMSVSVDSEPESRGALQPPGGEDDTEIYELNFVDSESIGNLPVPRVPDEFLFSEDHKLKHDLEILWDKETLGIYAHELHHNDEAALSSFKKGVKKCPDTGQYIVRLPFNAKKSMLTSNFKMCFARARQHQANMIRKPHYREQFLVALNTLIEENYIETVDINKEVVGPVVYLPYKGVVRDNHQTTKCRIVMDASAKANINSISLNQALYTGPNKIADIVMCLLRFMLGRFACISDIKQAFLRIWIYSQDRDALRFLIPEDITNLNSKMIYYR